MENNKKEVVAPGKEESISLKENKVLPGSENKKKKPANISLQKLDLGTNPINIASSNNFLYFNNIINFIKTQIKVILAIIFVIIILIVLFSLKNIIFYQSEEQKSETKEINVIESKGASSIDKQNLKPVNSSASSNK